MVDNVSLGGFFGKMTLATLKINEFSVSNDESHDPKIGTKVGEDEMGNEYYENLNEEWGMCFYDSALEWLIIGGRERWIEYKSWTWPPNADYMTPRWHGWIHHINDEPEVPSIAVPKYAVPMTPNLTGGRGAYKPYSTTTNKISAWEPMVKPRV